METKGPATKLFFVLVVACVILLIVNVKNVNASLVHYCKRWTCETIGQSYTNITQNVINFKFSLMPAAVWQYRNYTHRGDESCHRGRRKEWDLYKERQAENMKTRASSSMWNCWTKNVKDVVKNISKEHETSIQYRTCVVHVQFVQLVHSVWTGHR